MIKYLKYILFALIIIYSGQCFGQNSAEEIVQLIQDKTNQIKSFEVDANIHVDVDFINIKDRLIKIKYESPDKFTFDAKGLILLPKNGVQMEYMTLFNDQHTAINAGEEKIREVITQIIKVIPESIDSDIILAQLWIDTTEYRILRMKTFTRTSGSYIIDFEYSKSGDILPDRLVVTFEISNMSIPVKMMNDFMKDKSTQTDSLPKDAKVIIEYSNYKISSK